MVRSAHFYGLRSIKASCLQCCSEAPKSLSLDIEGLYLARDCNAQSKTRKKRKGSRKCLILSSFSFTDIGIVKNKRQKAKLCPRGISQNQVPIFSQCVRLSYLH